MSGEYTRTYVTPEDADVPGFSVFSRRDGVIRHFYTGEMSGAMADPGQDPRGGPDLDPLWLMARSKLKIRTAIPSSCSRRHLGRDHKP